MDEEALKADWTRKHVTIVLNMIIINMCWKAWTIDIHKRTVVEIHT
jgi:hypothetical protein